MCICEHKSRIHLIATSSEKCLGSLHSQHRVIGFSDQHLIIVSLQSIFFFQECVYTSVLSITVLPYNHNRKLPLARINEINIIARRGKHIQTPTDNQRDYRVTFRDSMRLLRWRARP